MGWLDSVLAILNKLLPGRKEAYVDELNRLNVEYAKALNEGRDTDAAVFKKKMKVLREKLGFSGEDV